MNCFNCNHELVEVTKDKEFNGKVLKSIPAFECPNCGEIIYSNEVTKQIESKLKYLEGEENERNETIHNR